jgi:hypothetical protein
MTKADRTTIVARIDAATDYDAATIRIHADGRITGILDANKTFNGPETMRALIGYVADWAADDYLLRA